MNTTQKIAESLRIEGITRDPTNAEFAAHESFILLPEIRIADLEDFLKVYAPRARLRDRAGMNVLVDRVYQPTPGGEVVRFQLQTLLNVVNTHRLSPWQAHIEYELIHPFTDGNGPAGRVLWYWQMTVEGEDSSSGFLQEFYRQSLRRHQAMVLPNR